MLNWQHIDTVLLDMDGTLLDLHFDSHFWREYLPRHYADKHGLSPEQALQKLDSLYDDVQGTIDWYCLDYWHKTLDMDIIRLKQELSHLIAVHPYVIEFLTKLQKIGKKRILVTNAHHDSLALKLEHTPIANYLDEIICAHQFRTPKEDPTFWDTLQQHIPFDPQRTVLIDDSLAVLRSARDYGIKHLLSIAQPDSQQPSRDITDFQAISSFSEIMPCPRS